MTVWDKLTKVVFGLLCVAVALMVLLSYVPLIQQNERMRQELQRLEGELEKQQQIEQQLLQAIDAMSNDRRTVERMAREKLGLAKEGETVIRFEEPPTNSVASKP